MQIQFPNEAPEYSGRELTLAFPAMVDGQRVECMITAEALEDHFGAASPRLEDMIVAFDAHRPRIEAAAFANLRLPRSCRNGTCRTCLCRLKAGRVRYSIEWPGVSREEKAEGYILPCVAIAETDLVIEVPDAVVLPAR